MELVAIPAGEFRTWDEFGQKTPHMVQIDKPFLLSATEVTQAQWQEVMGNNPSHFKGEQKPVENVSWHEAQSFCGKLSEREGIEYRLPTEMEWEYAYRAGTKEDYYCKYALDIGWLLRNSKNETHEVGQKMPSIWGLYDMTGNVCEWCQSLHRPYPYERTDGREDLQSLGERVVRGGTFSNRTAWQGDSACAVTRESAPPDRCSPKRGFRVLCVPPLRSTNGAQPQGDDK